VASELKRLGPQLVNLRKDNPVAILVSVDSANAISYMPFSDHADYMSLLHQMYNALYRLNVEPDFIPADGADLSRYEVVLVPPLYSASDAVLNRISEYVKNGGHLIMSLKSGFADDHSTVRDVMAPGPLRSAAGFHYQEFTNLAEPVRLMPDVYGVGDQNKGSIWEEFIVPESAEIVETFDHSYWRFPAITRNHYQRGTLTYEGTVLSDALQQETIRDVLKHAGLTSSDQGLPEQVKVRHGRNQYGKLVHYYLNFSGNEQRLTYPYGNGADLLTGSDLRQGSIVNLKPWDLVIVAER